jgi:hypothetical protein
MQYTIGTFRRVSGTFAQRKVLESAHTNTIIRDAIGNHSAGKVSRDLDPIGKMTAGQEEIYEQIFEKRP